MKRKKHSYMGNELMYQSFKQCGQMFHSQILWGEKDNTQTFRLVYVAETQYIGYLGMEIPTGFSTPHN